MERKSPLPSQVTTESDYLSQNQLVTLGDLDRFKTDLLREIKYILSQKHSAPEKQWLKSGEVRKLLKISSGTLQHWRDTEQIPFTKFGGIIYYDHEIIKSMLRNQ